MAPTKNFPKLHNAMWPGLVGKGDDSEPPIDLDTMLDLTAAAEVDGVKFDGVDLFLADPHTSIDADDDAIKELAEKVGSRNLAVGSAVAPVWEPVGGGSAMGSADDRKRFLDMVRKSCKILGRLTELGVRSYGVVRIDSAAGVEDWAADPAANTKIIAETFRNACDIASDHGERLAAEGEICWGGMHSWKDMADLLEEVAMPESVGFQADLAHTYLYMLGYNAPQHALLTDGYSEEEFWAAYKSMTDILRPWTYDFHVAQNDGTVHGTGSHDKTGRHCVANDSNGKLDIVECSKYWLLENGKQRSEISHICWDGCMFPNATLENQSTWNTILDTMIKVSNIGA